MGYPVAYRRGSRGFRAASVAAPSQDPRAVPAPANDNIRMPKPANDNRRLFLDTRKVLARQLARQVTRGVGRLVPELRPVMEFAGIMANLVPLAAVGTGYQGYPAIDAWATTGGFTCEGACVGGGAFNTTVINGVSGCGDFLPTFLSCLTNQVREGFIGDDLVFPDLGNHDRWALFTGEVQDPAPGVPRMQIQRQVYSPEAGPDGMPGFTAEYVVIPATVGVYVQPVAVPWGDPWSYPILWPVRQPSFSPAPGRSLAREVGPAPVRARDLNTTVTVRVRDGRVTRTTRHLPPGGRPPKRTRERKYGMSAGAIKILRAAQKVMHGVTESRDWINAIYHAIPYAPKSIRSVDGQLRFIWQHYADIDGYRMISNLMNNQQMDRYYGKIFGQLARELRNRGIVLGPAGTGNLPH